MKEDLIRRSDAIAASDRSDHNGYDLDTVKHITNIVSDNIRAIPAVKPREGE